MALEIKNSKEISKEPTLNVMIYGSPGVGKTSMAATAPKAIIADTEKGSQFLGSRGLDVDIAQIKKWADMKEFAKGVKPYESVVLDPVGELMQKLILSLQEEGLTSKNGTLTIQGWGVAKMRMKKVLMNLRDLDKNVIIVAHSEETKDEGNLIQRPKIQTKLVEDMEAMMDIIGYLQVIQTEKDKYERRLYVQPTERYHAKDRTGCLPEYVLPDWQEIIKYIKKKKEDGKSTSGKSKKSEKK